MALPRIPAPAGGPGDTRPNAAILPIGSGGRIAHFTQSGAHLLADTTGDLLG